MYNAAHFLSHSPVNTLPGLSVLSATARTSCQHESMSRRTSANLPVMLVYLPQRQLVPEMPEKVCQDCQRARYRVPHLWCRGSNELQLFQQASPAACRSGRFMVWSK